LTTVLAGRRAGKDLGDVVERANLYTADMRMSIKSA
jgi:hypothetical protein